MSKNKVNKPRLSFKDIQFKIEDLRTKRDELNQKTKDYINNLQEIDIEIVSALKLAKDVYKKKKEKLERKN